MTNSVFLQEYRETIRELRVMERQLSLAGTTGKPAGARCACYSGMPRGTNDAVSAAIQQQDGVEEMVATLRSQMEAMLPRFEHLLKLARNFRERYILRQYYQLGLPDSRIAEYLDVSSRHANRLRAELLAYLDNMSDMSAKVVARPSAS